MLHLHATLGKSPQKVHMHWQLLYESYKALETFFPFLVSATDWCSPVTYTYRITEYHHHYILCETE